MSLCRTTLFLVIVLAVSTEATVPARTLLHEEYCDEACHAAEDDHPEDIQAIIEEPHEICECQCNDDGWTPLHLAASTGCLDCLEVRKPLEFATRILVVVQHIITEPSNCPKDAATNAGDTAMHVAAQNCMFGAIEWLSEMEFNMSTTNTAGDTPLCIASRQDNEDCGEVVRHSITNGAEMCVMCADGDTPCGGCVNQAVCDILDEDGACACA